jgi:hypothetical protein
LLWLSRAAQCLEESISPFWGMECLLHAEIEIMAHRLVHRGVGLGAGGCEKVRHDG